MRTEPLFVWEDGVQGPLRASGSTAPLSSANDILEFARGVGATLNDRELRFLGVATFFAALRDFSRFAAAERELDALHPVLPDSNANASFQNGIADLKLHLFPIRGEHRHRQVDAAFAFMRARLEQLGAVDG